jgi:protein-tyrosine phosphatase
MKILMVCLGNICRSPMAEGILRTKADEYQLKITIDSAGTGGWHAGEHPDKRAVQSARKFGVDISKLVARQFSKNDFDKFDRIFVMDNSNYNDVIDLARTEDDRRKVFLLLNADEPDSNREVPDPYYGGVDGFDRTFLLMEKACEAIVENIRREKVFNK